MIKKIEIPDLKKISNKLFKTDKVKIPNKKLGLEKDTFEKQAKKELSKLSKDKKMDNLSPNNNHIENHSTEQPCFVSSAEDINSVKVHHYKFYPEDLKKMETMSPKEARAYRKQLLEERKIYYID